MSRPPMWVLKLGGELVEESGQLRSLSCAIARLAARRPLLVVHGGGREIDTALEQAGIPKRQVDGLRITDQATLAVVISVLAGLVNTRLVAAVNAAGGRAVGLTGADAGIVPVEPAPPHATLDGRVVNLGLVGRPTDHARPDLVFDLCARGYLPIVASIGLGSDGRLFNVNADVLAADLAVRLGAERLVIAGATAGVLDESGATIARLDGARLERLLDSGGATAGMITKLNACREARRRGVPEVVVADGRTPERLEAAVSGAIDADVWAVGTLVLA